MKQFISAITLVTITCAFGIAQERDSGDLGQITREEYARAEAAMRLAVEEGRLTGAEMRVKLGELRLHVGARGPEEVARNQQDFRATLRAMVTDGKLREEQARDMSGMVFPNSDPEWEDRYLTYLDDNPAIAKAVASGKIARENVMAGLRSREEERTPTEEEQIEALYQQMLEEHPELGRTPMAQLMPQLEVMLAEGRGKNLRPDRSTEARLDTFGRYLSDLIWNLHQFEADDKDLTKIYGIGVGEIRRQEHVRGKASE